MTDSDPNLDALLRDRLPKYGAPRELKEKLAAKYAENARDARDLEHEHESVRDHVEAAKEAPLTKSKRVAWTSVLAAAAALSMAAVVYFMVGRAGIDKPSPLAVEAVNDHLRVLYSEHPIEIESGGIHQVKPWFEGRLDFAPVEPFAGDGDFPLQGGSIAYYIDRKAAAFVFKRRLHVITLFVFRADGLTIPRNAETVPIDTRGFHVLMWRNADLGYALVSDVDPSDLKTLETKIRGQ